jgi:hypothetical protein
MARNNATNDKSSHGQIDLERISDLGKTWTVIRSKQQDRLSSVFE